MWHFPLVTQSDGDSNSLMRMWLCFLQPVTMMLYLLCWFDSLPMLFKRASQTQAGKLWARWGKGTLQFTEATLMPSTSTTIILEKRISLPFGYTHFPCTLCNSTPKTHWLRAIRKTGMLNKATKLYSFRAVTHQATSRPPASVRATMSICGPSVTVCPAPLILVGPCRQLFGRLSMWNWRHSRSVRESTLIGCSVKPAWEEKQKKKGRAPQACHFSINDFIHSVPFFPTSASSPGNFLSDTYIIECPWNLNPHSHPWN